MKHLRLITLAATIVACNSETIDPDDATRLVVEGFLYANQPVTDLKVSQLIPFNAEETDSHAIEDAVVEVAWNEAVYLMEARGDGTGYYDYMDNDLLIQEGATYSLRLSRDDMIVNAVTTVPPAPRDLEVSQPIIERAPISTFQDLRNLQDVEPIEVTWYNPNGDYYYVLVENIETDPEEINQLQFGDGGNFTLITEPTNLDVYNLRPNEISQYGRYQLVLYRVNQEYVDLYETAEQDSRDLTEPLTNVVNGLGIFTSFNSDTIHFEIVKP